MKKLSLVILLIIVAIGVYQFMPTGDGEAEFQLEEGYSYLYDGESLAGWRTIGGESTFEADGEDIVGLHGPGENTFLRTEKTYGDFSLKMQMRWDEPGNSGVLFRAKQRGGDGRAYGYQYELDPSERAWSAGIYDEARRGWLANLENNQAAREAVRLDDWNDVEIEARGPRLQTWINGVPAADIVDGMDAEGFIALQVHSGNVGVMRWRHIRIKELPPLAARGDSLLTAAEWRNGEDAGLSFEDGNLVVPASDQAPWIESRRQFKDVMLRMSLPACEQPTRVQMRYRMSSTGDEETFAEMAVYADRVESVLVGSAGTQAMEPVKLQAGERHEIIGITHGESVVFTVGEKDVLRLDDTGLYERGPLRIQPGTCGETLSVAGLDWYNIKEVSSEPLFYQTLDNEPARVYSPEEAQGMFSIAPGFTIELVAAEPLVEEPVAIAFDEHGRIYAVEMRGYMRDAYGTDSDAPVGRVVRMEDTDGDGRMDTSEVFLGELVNPRAVAVVNEGVLIAEPPNLWLCEQPARESLCENKRRVGSYADDVAAANVEHMENGLRRGLDNWLYNSKSNRQLRLVDGKMQVREGLARGQWGIAMDDYGRWFYNHNSTWLQADLFAAEDIVVPGENSYPEGLGVNLTDPAEVFSVRVNPGVNRAYLDDTLREDGRLYRATGVSGLTIYRGDQFPVEYVGDAFVPESAGNVVAQFDLDGVGLSVTAAQRLYEDERWGKRDFLGSADERFRPVDAMNGPDGALYIVDMYRGIIQDDHFLTDELRDQIFQRGLESPIGMGRIWRVKHSDGADTAPVNLADASDEQLLAALSHDNGWTRDTAQRLLLARDGDLAAPLSEIATGESTVPALHALWALSGRGELSRELVLAALAMQDSHRQVQALRAGRPLLQALDILALSESLAQAPLAVRMQLLFAGGDHAADPRIRQVLLALGVNGDDIYLRQALVRAVRGHEYALLGEAFASGALASDSDGSRELIASLTANAYRAIRTDLASTDPADPALLELLAMAQDRSGDAAWQQVAMLTGFERVAEASGFAPAQLEHAPPIFADGSISEKDPLWDARLSGRRAFTWPGDELAMGIKPLSPEQLQAMAKGEVFYVQCAACHGADGKGISGLAPALAGASWVTGPPEWLGRIVLQGMTGPVEVNGEVFDGVMPPHGHLPELDDATLAGLMTFMRRSWGNTANPVSTDTVASIRAASADRTAPWTARELETVPFDRGFSRFIGKYKVSFVTFTIKDKPEGLFLSVPMYGSGVLQQQSDTVFVGAAAGESVKLEFVIDPDGSVNKLILFRDGQEIPLDRVE